MKRKFPLLITTVAMAACLGLGIYAAGSQSSTWTKIGDGYYSGLSASGGTVVLHRNLTEADYAAIQAQLIDPNRAPDLAAAEKAKNDPDAVLPDNMLPDGRFLKENWEELEQQLVEQYQSVLVRQENGTYQAPTIQNRKDSKVVLDAKEKLSLVTEEVSVDKNTVLLPKQDLDSPLTSTSMPDGKSVVAYSDQEMWLVSSPRKTPTLAVPDTYQGKTYADMVAESYEKYAENIVLWCGQVTPSPDSQNIAFAANKNDLDGGYSVFVYDVEAGTEKLIRPGGDDVYLIAGWVDEENILCYKIKGETRTFVVVGLDGSETELQFAIPDSQLIAVKSGLVAYTNPENNMVYVGRYEGTGALTPVYQEEVGGSLRLRTGVNEFNDDASKLALVYVPDGSPYQRNFKIFDLAANTSERAALPQSTSAGKSNVLEVSWMNDGNLLIVADPQKGEDAPSYSTWKYAVEEGS